MSILAAGLAWTAALHPALALGAEAVASATAPPVAGRDATASTPNASLADVNYRLGTGDKLRIIVFGEQSLSGEFVVSDTGEVAFPLIGNVHAAGLTVAQFEDGLRTRLADGYLRDPRVSAEVENYRPFYILGEVQKPGEYPYTSGLTVMNAVATAGGFSYRANTKIIIVRHAGAPSEQQIRLTATTPVGPGDTIVIRERFF